MASHRNSASDLRSLGADRKENTTPSSSRSTSPLPPSSIPRPLSNRRSLGNTKPANGAENSGTATGAGLGVGIGFGDRNPRPAPPSFGNGRKSPALKRSVSGPAQPPGGDTPLGRTTPVGRLPLSANGKKNSTEDGSSSDSSLSSFDMSRDLQSIPKINTPPLVIDPRLADRLLNKVFEKHDPSGTGTVQVFDFINIIRDLESELPRGSQYLLVTKHQEDEFKKSKDASGLLTKEDFAALYEVVARRPLLERINTLVERSTSPPPRPSSIPRPPRTPPPRDSLLLAQLKSPGRGRSILDADYETTGHSRFTPVSPRSSSARSDRIGRPLPLSPTRSPKTPRGFTTQSPRSPLSPTPSFGDLDSSILSNTSLVSGLFRGDDLPTGPPLASSTPQKPPPPRRPSDSRHSFSRELADEDSSFSRQNLFNPIIMSDITPTELETLRKDCANAQSDRDDYHKRLIEGEKNAGLAKTSYDARAARDNEKITTLEAEVGRLTQENSTIQKDLKHYKTSNEETRAQLTLSESIRQVQEAELAKVKESREIERRERLAAEKMLANYRQESEAVENRLEIEGKDCETRLEKLHLKAAEYLAEADKLDKLRVVLENQLAWRGEEITDMEGKIATLEKKLEDAEKESLARELGRLKLAAGDPTEVLGAALKGQIVGNDDSDPSDSSSESDSEGAEKVVITKRRRGRDRADVTKTVTMNPTGVEVQTDPIPEDAVAGPADPAPPPPPYLDKGKGKAVEYIDKGKGKAVEKPVMVEVAVATDPEYALGKGAGFPDFLTGPTIPPITAPPPVDPAEIEAETVTELIHTEEANLQRLVTLSRSPRISFDDCVWVNKFVNSQSHTPNRVILRSIWKIANLAERAARRAARERNTQGIRPVNPGPTPIPGPFGILAWPWQMLRDIIFSLDHADFEAVGTRQAMAIQEDLDAAAPAPETNPIIVAPRGIAAEILRAGPKPGVAWSIMTMVLWFSLGLLLVHNLSMYYFMKRDQFSWEIANGSSMTGYNPSVSLNFASGGCCWPCEGATGQRWRIWGIAGDFVEEMLGWKRNRVPS